MPYIELPRTHYTPGELAKLIGCSRQTIVKWIEQGRIPNEQTPGGHHRIPADFVKGVPAVERIEARA